VDRYQDALPSAEIWLANVPPDRAWNREVNEVTVAIDLDIVESRSFDFLGNHIIGPDNLRDGCR
jgi:hypothetical protein